MRILFLPLLFCTVIASAQVTDTALYQTYLNSNKEVLTVDQTQPLRMMDAAFCKNRLFLFGENHGSAQPLAIDPLLFAQLHQKAGVRYYVAEVDDTKAWMLNNFLKDGNEQWLKKVFASWVADTAQWASQENYNRYKVLRSFYTSLPANKKFTILGVDMVQDFRLLKEQVLFYAQNKKGPLPMLDSLATITDTITSAYRKNLGIFCRRLLQQIGQLPSNYRQALGSQLGAFEHTVRSFSYFGMGMYRDSIMYRNFESLTALHQLGNKKLYGFFGYFHTLQIAYGFGLPFAAHLQQGNGPFAGKTVSIQMQAINSTTMLPYMGQLKQMIPASFADKLRQDYPYFPFSQKYIPFNLTNDDMVMMIAGIENLKAVTAPKSITLFRLNGSGSPYLASRQLMAVTGYQTLKPSSSTAPTTAAFQYVLLFRDSKAALPLEK